MSSRKQWKRGRERDRRHARFLIRERVAVGCEPGQGDGSSATTIHDDVQEVLDRIHEGHRSYFSVSKLEQHFELLSTRIPTSVFLKELPKNNVRSRLGLPHLERVETYLRTMDVIPIMEYLVLLGRYPILSSLLLGGISPCIRGTPNHASASAKMDQQLQIMANRLVKRFFNYFPLSLSSYIVKRVVDMRVQSILSTQQFMVCGICQEETPCQFGLVYTKDFVEGQDLSCHCTFCELCFWKDILEHVDSRTGDVVPCPCCHLQPESERGNGNDQAQQDPHERSQESLRLYQSLPIDSMALKRSGRKKKKVGELEALSTTWTQGVLPHLGLCQSVRKDKLFTFTEKEALQHVRGCLVAGVDVNTTNEYGQSALYVAAWHGNSSLVRLLLEYGASPFALPNGIDMTLERLCSAHGHVDCLEIIHQFQKEHWAGQVASEQGADMTPLRWTQHNDNLDLEVLIDQNTDHPGAGSYLISHCIQQVEQLVQLWEHLPIAPPPPKKKQKADACAERAYFCDAEGWLRSTLEKSILEAFQTRRQCVSTVIVLPHMRFLHYSHVGSSLAPHIDLCRVDSASGRRSTHSFLLYLTTCERGGETSLLQDVTGEGRDIVLARAKPERGRLLLFPHECPHEGNIVECVPKLLIRGEVVLIM